MRSTTRVVVMTRLTLSQFWSSYDVPDQHKICRSPDLEAVNLYKKGLVRENGTLQYLFRSRNLYITQFSSEKLSQKNSRVQHFCTFEISTHYQKQKILNEASSALKKGVKF